ncbi:MAG TPA: hypothetical protein DEO64_08850 [Alcaligenes faecalis]|nr:hypothetical protein [Alcaligenes faecalis]
MVFKEVVGTNGKKAICSVARLKGHEPEILNMTKQKANARLYSLCKSLSPHRLRISLRMLSIAGLYRIRDYVLQGH